MTRKEKSKIIAKHFSKRFCGFYDNESAYVACIMDALKEIEAKEEKLFSQQVTNFKKIIRALTNADELTELLWSNGWEEIFEIPEFSTKQELLEWLEQEVQNE